MLDFPWNDPAGELAYVDLKRHPNLISGISEAQIFPELGEFLQLVNSARPMLETAKCDAWATTDLNVEEDIYNASCKFASYVDVVFSDTDARLSLPAHEDFARKLVELLRRAPEIPSGVEVCVRRCYFRAGELRSRGLLFHFVCERLRQRRTQRASELGSGTEAFGECNCFRERLSMQA